MEPCDGVAYCYDEAICGQHLKLLIGICSDNSIFHDYELGDGLTPH